MPTKKSAADFLPDRITLPNLREAAEGCRGCELYKRATHVVFGEGARHAPIMFVGEVPGDYEDRVGRPFVGPAGRWLNDALDEVGIDRRQTYVTNAVKHFSWEERGKRRLHKKPKWSEIQACKPWLQAEILTVAPQLIVCLGATAAQSLLGADFRITRHRGEVIAQDGSAPIVATYHPSAILRAPEKEDRERMRAEFLADLRSAVQHVHLATRAE